VTLLVLFILAVIWAAVLLPPWLQSRSENRPADSITSFRNQLSVLERRAAIVGPHRGAHGARPAARPVARSAGMTNVARQNAALRRSDVRRRRREVFFTLAGAAAVTMILALWLGGVVWALHLGVDALLGGYVLLLVQAQQREAERHQKVRYLAERRRPARQPEPVLAFRRSATN
jgi:hypothetical protein